jgi:hypothetical protein
MALYADGTTRLTNIASWRVKETDRIAALAAELRELGAAVEEGADFIAVTPPAAEAWRAAAIETYDDHRIAMCLSLAAFNALAGARPPVTVRILEPRCVGQTFPDYFETLFGVARQTRRSRHHHRRPVGLRQGTLAAAVAARLAMPTSTRARCTGPRRSPRATPASPTTTAPRPRASRRRSSCASRAAGRCSAGATWATRCATRPSARARRRSRPGPKCALRCIRFSSRCAACRAWWPTGATWAA